MLFARKKTCRECSDETEQVSYAMSAREQRTKLHQNNLHSPTISLVTSENKPVHQILNVHFRNERYRYLNVILPFVLLIHLDIFAGSCSLMELHLCQLGDVCPLSLQNDARRYLTENLTALSPSSNHDPVVSREYLEETYFFLYRCAQSLM